MSDKLPQKSSQRTLSSLSKPPKLENDKLWRAASDIAVYAYAQLDVLPEEEEYGMAARFRQKAFDVTSDIAEAIGSLDPRDKSYSYGQAMREAYSLRNALVMANKTGLLGIEPSVIVMLDNLIEALAAEIDTSTKRIPEYLKQFSMQDERK